MKSEELIERIKFFNSCFPTVEEASRGMRAWSKVGIIATEKKDE